MHVYFPPEDALHGAEREKNPNLKTWGGQGHSQGQKPEPGPPSSYPRALSTHPAPFSRERSELGISAPEIIWVNFNQASVSPVWALMRDRGVFLDWNFPEMT